MRQAMRWLVMAATLAAGVAAVAQTGDPDIRRGGGRGDLPPLRRELPPEQDQRTPRNQAQPQPQPQRDPPQRREDPPQRRDDPPPRRDEPRPPILDADRGREPVVNVIDKGPRDSDSVGTAFAIDADGNWVTAQHVVEDCRMVYVLVNGDWLPVSVLAIHPVADVAVVRSRNGGTAIQIAAADNLQLDQDGFQIGYPQFKPGATHVKLIGRVRVSRTKRGAAMELAYSWAEISRRPDFEGTLGGISGGPIVDSRGVVVGVNILESSRRGRVTTSSPVSMQQAMSQARVTARSAATMTVNSDNLAAQADAVRASHAVVRVFCAFHKDSQPPRVRRN